MTTMTLRLLAVALLFSMPQAALAQSPPGQAAPAAATTPSGQLLKPEQLDALVAPIALYPDTLLAEVFMASTYPLEIVQAARWAEANKNLKDDELKGAVDKQKWDNSVKALVATPSVLEMMSSKLDWTQQLGDAILAQQPDVMDAVQRLRAKAQANNKLTSSPQQTVSTQQQDGRQIIVIAPTEPDEIYVPYYDPGVVYGAWPYPDYLPYSWPAPGYIAAGVIATGIAFDAGYALGRWATGGYRWGGGFDWGGRNINVNRSINVNNVRVNNWSHSPAHRQGVRYNNANVAQKFGGNRNVGGSAARTDFRGRNGQQVLHPGGGNRGNVGGGAANRLSTGGNRANVGANRPSRGNRTTVAARPAGKSLGSSGSVRRTNVNANRSRQNLGGGGGGRGGHAVSRGGGGARAAAGGGGRGGGVRGGGRRSGVKLKHDIVLLGRLDNGVGIYRFAYNGSGRAYVGVMAQEVQALVPEAVVRGRDGYLRVYYDKVGVKFQTYDQWIASGARSKL